MTQIMRFDKAPYQIRKRVKIFRARCVGLYPRRRRPLSADRPNVYPPNMDVDMKGKEYIDDKRAVKDLDREVDREKDKDRRERSDRGRYSPRDRRDSGASNLRFSSLSHLITRICSSE